MKLANLLLPKKCVLNWLGLGLNMEITDKKENSPSLDWRDIAPKVIYRAYPHSDLLPIDPPREGENICDFTVRAADAGDTLFLHLCREANEDIDAKEYLQRLKQALSDIEEVRNAFEIIDRAISWLKQPDHS